jgi:hypothetical protein
MAGTEGRSGGRNRRGGEVLLKGDGGRPESPRELSTRAKFFFDWLIDRLGAAEDGSGWDRADGSLLASIAELLESEEILGELIRKNPGDLKLHRMRGQFSDRLVRASGLLGLCPKDRERLPKARAVVEEDDPFHSLLDRMAQG